MMVKTGVSFRFWGYFCGFGGLGGVFPFVSRDLMLLMELESRAMT
jgi:hypothetical protein